MRQTRRNKRRGRGQQGWGRCGGRRSVTHVRTGRESATRGSGHVVLHSGAVHTTPPRDTERSAVAAVRSAEPARVRMRILLWASIFLHTFFISFSKFSSSWPSDSLRLKSAISLSADSRYCAHWLRSCSSLRCSWCS